MAAKMTGLTQHRIVSQEEWLTERLKLLKEEKALTHKSDEITRLRQALPWVKVEGGGRVR